MFSFFKKAPIVIPKPIYEEMVSHARDEYPRRCCGILIGNPGKIVFEAHRAANLNKEGDNDKYLIDPTEIKLITRTARIQSLDIIGFYHSHPDQPDTPSPFDMETAQPGLSYVIISIAKGAEASVKSWSTSRERESLKEEGIKIREQ